MKLNILKGFFITQINHWVLCTVCITVLQILSIEQLHERGFILLGILPFLLFLFRNCTNKAIVFAATHLLAMAAAAYVFVYPVRDNLATALIFSLIINGYAALSLIVRIQNKDRLEKPIPPLAAIAVIAFMMLIQWFREVDVLGRHYTTIFVAYITMFFIYHYLERYQNFVATSDVAAGYIPRRAIYKTGIKYVTLFTLVAASLLFILSRTSLTDMPFSGLPTFEIESSTPAPAAEPFDLFYYDSFNLESLIPYDEPPEPDAEPMNPIWLLIASIIVAALLAAAAIFGLVRLFLFLRDRFRRIHRKSVLETGDDTDVREKLEVSKTKSETGRIFSFFSPQERIRRIYRKYVLERKSLLIGTGEPELLCTFTAGECGRALDAQALTALYDKARYSGLECTPEDVKAAKRI